MLLGVTGSGKTFTMAKVIEAVEPPGAGDGAQQDAGGAALSRVQELLPAQCGRIFRFVLRLLPARSLRSGGRSLHRKRSDHQRRTRQAAALGDAVAVRAARCADCGFGELHLRPGIAGSLLRHDAVSRERARRSSARTSRASWSTFFTSAPTATSAAERFACAAM